jgi:hypothetical protein
MKAYYYTPMTYHCYKVGPTDMLAGCHFRQAHSATRGSLLPCPALVCVCLHRLVGGEQVCGYSKEGCLCRGGLATPLVVQKGPVIEQPAVPLARLPGHPTAAA